MGPLSRWAATTTVGTDTGWEPIVSMVSTLSTLSISLISLIGLLALPST